MSTQQHVSASSTGNTADREIREEIAQYYASNLDAARHHDKFLPIEYIRVKEDMELVHTISFDFGENWEDPLTRQGVHDAVRDHVLSWELEDFPESPVVFPDEYNSSPVYLSSILDEYGMEDDCFKPAFIEQMHGAVDGVYGDDVRSLFDEGSPRIAVCEPRYLPKYGREPALHSCGELDIALFDLEQNHVRYTEVKSNGGEGLTPAKSQIDRFAEYADELGWSVEGRIAIYDTRDNQIFVCGYTP